MRSAAKGTRKNSCKLCDSLYRSEHYQANKEMYQKKARKWEKDNGGSRGKQLRLYSLTEESYLALYNKFNGLCWICLKEEATCVDHDHSCCPSYKSCGKCVRGFLCTRCNWGIGIFKDDTNTLESAIKYLTTKD